MEANMWHGDPAETTGMVEPGAEPMRRLAVIDWTQPDRRLGPGFLAGSWRVLGAFLARFRATRPPVAEFAGTN